MCLDRTDGTIADPSMNVEPLGLITGPRPEEHTLHPACHADKARDPSHHTVEMSGASSAFMPTTL